jgi:signal transduction histidine kinase
VGFRYTVSHDLRSPLRAIAGFSHLIQEESGHAIDEVTRDRLAKIEAATLRMDTLIDDMLVLARVSRSAVRTEAVDLAEVAREVIADLRSEHPHRQVEVRIAAIPLVTGDRGLLRIALDNLLRNAWKFTVRSDPARIEVFGGRVGPTVSCHVSDNGIGFDMQFRAKLFRPFERIHDEKDVEGTGIGLATVARIIDRLGGEVEADGRLGEGATFTFKLPAAAFTPKT